MNAVSIIIPCYNEENNLKRGVLDEVANFLSQARFEYEVLICNDKSTDNSLSLVKKFAKTHPKFKILDLPKGGKPGAIWGGLQKAKYPIVLFTDMDQSTPISEIKKLLPFYDKDYDIVIGSRGQDRTGFNFIRLLGSKVFSLFRKILLQSPIDDTQCGFKSMKTDLAKEIFPCLNVIKNIQSGQGWRVSAYDVEMLFIAGKMGCKIKEVPVLWQDEDTSVTKGDANAKYLIESKRMAQEVWRVFTNNLKGLYEQKS
ncbi:glycosyltransferase [Patescibacteria group bacterium]|nr:glycosyltransferase [Patescibacteria group bacterium]